MRAFTLTEIMVVVVIIGIVAAISVPGIAEMAARAEGDRALRENASVIAAARDNARGRGACLDYVQRPAFPQLGPYVVDVFVVACPGEALPATPQFVITRPVSPSITSLVARPVVGGVPGAPTDTVHFSRDGSLYAPIAMLQVEAVVNGAVRRFRVYPAAGTVEIEEAP